LAFWKKLASEKKIAPHIWMFLTSTKLERKRNKRKEKKVWRIKKSCEHKMPKFDFAFLRNFLGPPEVDTQNLVSIVFVVKNIGL
jgi:hypothetical protein